MKKLLIIAATHGNEKIGIEVIKKLTKQGYERSFDFVIANPQAEKKNVRFIDIDLNRAYPGDKKSSLYEKRKAFAIGELSKKYEFVIDIHEASQGTEDFIIIPKGRLPNHFPIQYIALDKVLLWPNPKGPLGGIIENEIELEFGIKGRDRKEVIKKAARVIIDFIQSVNLQKYSQKKQKIFFVYGKIKTSDKFTGRLKDFKKVNLRGENFYPLLVNQYLDLGILCYKMR